MKNHVSLCNDECFFHCNKSFQVGYFSKTYVDESSQHLRENLQWDIDTTLLLWPNFNVTEVSEMWKRMVCFVDEFLSKHVQLCVVVTCINKLMHAFTSLHGNFSWALYCHIGFDVHDTFSRSQKSCEVINSNNKKMFSLFLMWIKWAFVFLLFTLWSGDLHHYVLLHELTVQISPKSPLDC